MTQKLKILTKEELKQVKEYLENKYKKEFKHNYFKQLKIKKKAECRIL